MQFILKNYLVIVLIGFFFVFALIGYLIDLLKKVNDGSKEEIKDSIRTVEIAKLDSDNMSNKETDNTDIKKDNDNDDLLKNYDNDNSEVITEEM